MVLIVCLTRLKYQTEHLVSSYVLLGCGEYLLHLVSLPPMEMKNRPAKKEFGLIFYFENK